MQSFENFSLFRILNADFTQTKKNINQMRKSKMRQSYAFAWFYELVG